MSGDDVLTLYYEHTHARTRNKKADNVIMLFGSVLSVDLYIAFNCTYISSSNVSDSDCMWIEYNTYGGVKWAFLTGLIKYIPIGMHHSSNLVALIYTLYMNLNMLPKTVWNKVNQSLWDDSCRRKLRIAKTQRTENEWKKDEKLCVYSIKIS